MEKIHFVISQPYIRPLAKPLQSYLSNLHILTRPNLLLLELLYINDYSSSETKKLNSPLRKKRYVHTNLQFEKRSTNLQQ